MLLEKSKKKSKKNPSPRNWHFAPLLLMKSSWKYLLSARKGWALTGWWFQLFQPKLVGGNGRQRRWFSPLGMDGHQPGHQAICRSGAVDSSLLSSSGFGGPVWCSMLALHLENYRSLVGADFPLAIPSIPCSMAARCELKFKLCELCEWIGKSPFITIRL